MAPVATFRLSLIPAGEVAHGLVQTRTHGTTQEINKYTDWPCNNNMIRDRIKKEMDHVPSTVEHSTRHSQT